MVASSRIIALHASVAVALATLALAAAAVAHQLSTGTFRPQMALSFGVWPLLTGIVSFVVALVVSLLLARRAHDGSGAGVG